VGRNWIVKWAAKKAKEIYPAQEKDSSRSARRFRHLNTHPLNYPIFAHEAK
jgi:hypothetical protein